MIPGLYLCLTISVICNVFFVCTRLPLVDGIMADLGVSSHSLMKPTRGFSTRFEGDLDMRMDKRQETNGVRCSKYIHRATTAQDV